MLFLFCMCSLKQSVPALHEACHSTWGTYIYSSDQFSRSVIPDSLQLHELHHARPPCPSPTPRVYPSSCPLSRWCHLTISSSVLPFPSCLQSFPTSGSFPMSQLFASGGQNIKSFSFNVRLRVWGHLEQTGTAPFPALSPVIMSEQCDKMEREWMGRNIARRKGKKRDSERGRAGLAALMEMLIRFVQILPA